MFELNQDKEAKVQKIVERKKIEMIDEEIKENISCAKWKA